MRKKKQDLLETSPIPFNAITKIFAFRNTNIDGYYIYVGAVTYFEASELMFTIYPYANKDFDMNDFKIFHAISKSVWDICNIEEDYRNMPFFISNENFNKIKPFIIREEKNVSTLTRNKVTIEGDENNAKVYSNLYTLNEFKSILNAAAEERKYYKDILEKFFAERDYVIKIDAEINVYNKITKNDNLLSFETKTYIYTDHIIIYSKCQRETENILHYIENQYKKYKGFKIYINKLKEYKAICIDNSLDDNIKEYKEMVEHNLDFDSIPNFIVSSLKKDA